MDFFGTGSFGEISAKSPGGASLPNGDAWMHTAHVLIADDDPMLRVILEHKLTDAGYVVDSVGDGRAAVDAVERLRPDILILDGMMPIMDGFEALRRLKASPHGDSLAIVMLTALDRDEDMTSALDLGASDYLVKPVNLDDLVARLGQLTPRRRRIG